MKPETWADEKVGKISRDARLLFVVLITMADDEGRFRSLPSAVLGHGYPYDPDAARKLTRWMSELVEQRLVVIYEIDGVQYGWLPGWKAHQRINKASGSVLPAPSMNGAIP